MSRYQHGYPWPSLATLPYSPLLPRVIRATSRIGTELLYVCSSWSTCLCTSMRRGPQEYISYEIVPTSPAVSRMSGSFDFDSFRDELLYVIRRKYRLFIGRFNLYYLMTNNWFWHQERMLENRRHYIWNETPFPSLVNSSD